MSENYYYGHGKLLLCSEYFVLDGAKALALPTVLGQNMSVKYQRSDDPKIIWKSYDSNGKLWFECNFDIWRFNTLEGNTSEEALVLQSILRQARVQNIHFLREEVDTIVETRLEFPLTWGLGSSSSLIYNIAQLAYISPFELQDKTFGGSGYDIACAQSLGPIMFQKKNSLHSWEATEFNPLFKNKIFFVYLNKKQNTKDAIENYYNIDLKDKNSIIKRLNEICDQMSDSIDLVEFESLIYEHENLISESLSLKKVKDLYFSDFWGSVKSLGAWGGDFALVTSSQSKKETQEYFKTRGFNTLLTFDELISQRTVNSYNTDFIKTNDDLRA